MPIPLLEISPKTQNQRVAGYDVPDEDDSSVYRLSRTATVAEIDELIWAAYRQIFSEHLILESYRQLNLESQLRNRAITVREFVRGLGKSEVYRSLVGETNSNYRLVDITFKRFLGRASYSKDEQIAQSIVIATRGLPGFIDSVVDSDEYLSSFGNDILPYQRRRLEGRPFNLVNPRYSDYWRNHLMMQGLQGRSFYEVRQYKAGELDKRIVRQAIPATFLSMAQGLSTPQIDSQRHVARATSSSIKIPDMTRSDNAAKPTVKPTEVALPYRYIPANPKV
ncbi:phycobilisome rod-core linker polypeptide [Leptolyngbya sp. FACHB-36]|uniref:phycobilisome rod-core linker polypeptide n=1 Tax=Leptolyngbya sp. FACHB-36 TaxID=2692808 RepID=UPI00168071D9|nr:phycobilisome rod-core linker polypeptide [Leptolyngbya sp. FACHB-36]MBD2018935.1 phycobilisome rod-core linker polypeptide [Leptolyngbya sp. FACHB-36]